MFYKREAIKASLFLWFLEKSKEQIMICLSWLHKLGLLSCASESAYYMYMMKSNINMKKQAKEIGFKSL